MGIMVYSLLWVTQDFDHQPYGSGVTEAALPECSVCSFGLLVSNSVTPGIGCYNMRT